MTDILKQWIENSQNIVFFGGAGVSTESGIPDFRSKDGLYNQKYKYSPEKILSHSFFYSNTNKFFQFYIDKMNCLEASPNVCHEYLYDLEKKGKLKAIITQNIDGLHTKAGNKNVFELHGSIFENYCDLCKKKYLPEEIFYNKNYKCDCGGLIKPNVVLYEEPLNDEIVKKSIKVIKECDLLIVAGTSLTVYPASSFIRFYCGKKLVIINKDSTQYDRVANLVINEPLGKVFKKL